MNNRRTTVYDVAEQAKVSIATVSFAFTRPDKISSATRERVLGIARELGYMPSASARGLARGKTGALGLHSFDLKIARPQSHERPAPANAPEVATPPPGDSLIGWDDADDDLLSDPRAFPLYVDEIQRGFELECRNHDRPVMLTRGTDTTTSVAESAGRVDGLAIFPGASAAASIAEVSLKMPIVLFSTPPGDDRHHRVLADNAGGMRDLVTHLVREHHVSDFGFVGSLRVTDYRERFESFRSTLAEFGIATPETPLDASFLDDGVGYSEIMSALKNGKLPRAVVCASDQLALPLQDLLQAAGVRIPEDVVVTGFDGILAGRLSEPPLTTVRQPMEAMGRAAANLLLDSTRKEADAPVVVRFETKLIVRQSCGCKGSIEVR